MIYKELNSSSSIVHGIGQRLGDLLVARGHLDKINLAYVNQKQLVEEQPLWRMLVKSGLVSEGDVVRTLSEILEIKYMSYEKLEDPQAEILELFNQELCINGHFIPLRRDADKILVVLGDALPDSVSHTVFKRCGLRCNFLYTDFSQLPKIIRYWYYFIQNPPEQLIQQEIKKLTVDTDHILSPDKLLSHLLHLAIKSRATDIHITPGSNSLHVLFRIDGVLSPILSLPVFLNRLLGFIKLNSEMDISEQRRPQDGSFRIHVLDSPITIRVSTIVTEFGERMVMRLLPESHDIAGLAELGFFKEDVELIARMTSKPAGMILITGPTGSGKSSTLHAALRMQQLIERNVLTVEDPLEYRVPGAGQTEVNRRAGYDFSNALRHFLRHDPDVILLGEMRDAETALAALEASATGHLVLSTLHVTSVYGVVPRLLPMGLQPSVIAENLLLVINQRLVRINCSSCSEQTPFTSAECTWLGVSEGAMGWRGSGCPSCRQTGYKGRMPIYEIMQINEPMANAIADGAGREAIRRLAVESGFRDIEYIGKRRVLLGQTTAQEIERVIGYGPQS